MQLVYRHEVNVPTTTVAGTCACCATSSWGRVARPHRDLARVCDMLRSEKRTGTSMWHSRHMCLSRVDSSPSRPGSLVTLVEATTSPARRLTLDAVRSGSGIRCQPVVIVVFCL